MSQSSNQLVKQCQDCMAYCSNLSEHLCPPWLKILVADYRRNHNGQSPTDENIVEEQVQSLFKE